MGTSYLANSNAIVHDGFSPYEDNGGTTVAIAGTDFCIVASDTRQSVGYSINSRYAPKAFKITDKAVLASTGMYADTISLKKRIQARLEWYRHQHEKQASTPAIAQMLQTVLYYKRFFPYYTFNIIGGLDEEGKGAVYSFDPVGSYERENYRASGSGGSLIQPFLDSQIGLKNQVNPPDSLLSKDRAIKIVKDAFTAATERDIYTGDCLEIFLITQEGVAVERFDLKRD